MMGNNKSGNFARRTPASHEPIAQFARRLLDTACAQRRICPQNFMRQADPSAGFGHKAHFVARLFSQTVIDTDDMKLRGIWFFLSRRSQRDKRHRVAPARHGQGIMGVRGKLFQRREKARRGGRWFFFRTRSRHGTFQSARAW